MPDDINILPPELSDDALAASFADEHADRLRYVDGWKRWLLWNGARWEVDGTRLAFDLIRLHLRPIARAAQATDNRKGNTIAKAIASAKTVAAVERLVAADRRIAATVDQWDQDLHLLNTPGGVVDLKTGRLGEHRATRYMTKMTAVSPAASGVPPTLWLSFLDRIMGGNVELIAYVQRMLGYTLTGLTIEHALFFFYGGGANGKGVLINTATQILADYAVVSPVEVFTESNSDRHPTELAMMRGARLVASQETEQGRRWAESRIKSLTGGDDITARFMRQDHFTFKPRFKLIIAGNNRPGLRTVDEAMRRRFHLIPFNITIPKEERDPNLPAKLKSEHPAILRWMIEGALAWRRMGLRPPIAVLDATADYLGDEDAVGRWIDARCERDPGAVTRLADAFADWKLWAKDAGEFLGTDKRLSSELARAERGLTKGKTENGVVFHGIRLRHG